MTTQFPTKNAIPASSRATMVNLLNTNLANAIDLSLQAKHAHWNVKGANFFQLHELFDQVQSEVASWADLIAERAVQLGGVAEGPIQAVVQRSQLPAYGLVISRGRDHVEALSRSLASFGKVVRDSIRQAERAGDAGTADIFSEVSRSSDKMLWFVTDASFDN